VKTKISLPYRKDSTFRRRFLVEFNPVYVQVAVEWLRLEFKYRAFQIEWEQARDFRARDHWFRVRDEHEKRSEFLTNLLAGIQPASWDEPFLSDYYTYSKVLQDEISKVRFEFHRAQEAGWADRPCSLVTQTALELIRSHSKHSEYWKAVLAGEEVAALRQTRQRPSSPKGLEKLKRAAFASLGSMDTLTAKLAYEQARAKADSAGIKNPILVAFATSDRYFIKKWQEKYPEGKPVNIALPDNKWQEEYWQTVSWELCEDVWAYPEIFVVDADSHPQYAKDVISSAGYSGP
jgi:hypothetical protein